MNGAAGGQRDNVPQTGELDEQATSKDSLLVRSVGAGRFDGHLRVRDVAALVLGLNTGFRRVRPCRPPPHARTEP